MQSVIVILALILFFIFIYGYTSYSIEHHKNSKKLYIPLNNKDDKNIESSTIGSPTAMVNASPRPIATVAELALVSSPPPVRASALPPSIYFDGADTCSVFAKYGDDNFCLNNGSCISVSGTDGKLYNKCECVKPFAGKHCKKNIGVQVKIHDNFTSPTVIERVPMFKHEGHDYFIQDNNYL